MKQKLYINGGWVEGSYEVELFSPFSGDKLADIACASLEQVDQALTSAVRAKKKMRMLTAYERSLILEEVSSLLMARREEAARLIAAESAKPIKAAYVEVDRTATTFKLAAEEAKRIYGETIPTDSVAGGENRLAFTKKEPVGVVGAITPFNFPMNLVAHKLGPAFAAGNSVMLKPAEQTPLSAFFIAGLFHEAGLPSGALNVVIAPGKEIAEYIVKDERVNYISFTGSPKVGEQVRSSARLKRVTLELGSNSAVIIDRDVDAAKVAARCVAGAFSNQGQVCISLQRIYVVEDIYESFIEHFMQEMRQLVLGDPLDPDTDLSALINPAAAARALAWVKEAMQQGAGLLAGGIAEGGLMQPTVLVEVPESAKVIQEEVFAPLVCINRVSSIEQGIELVNQSQYGLQAGIYTNQLGIALDAADKLQAGGVMINDIPTFRLDHLPYGGWKSSGIGREGIKYAMEEMCETKLVIFNRN